MEKVKRAVPASEEDLLTRKLLAWLNTFPKKPVKLIQFEYLPADAVGMALATIQAAYIIKK